MIAIVWRFHAAAGRETAFEAAYGPNGAWAHLFRKAAGYVRTDLLRGGDGSYLTIDVWRAAADWDAFRTAHRAAYERLDAACEALTRAEEMVGVFTTVE